jgi:hypothetical protein
MPNSSHVAAPFLPCGEISTEVTIKHEASDGRDASISFMQRLAFLLDMFLPKSFSPLIVSVFLVQNSIHHRQSKQCKTFDNHISFKALKLTNSQIFRKVTIFCSLVLAILPTIEIPVSVAAPCWLSFFVELLCYTVLSLRVSLELLCYNSSWSKNVWFSLFRLSLMMCWVDVVVSMVVVSWSGGDWLSFNNCGMPDAGRERRSSGWIYVIARFSRFLRPILFLEWNIRTRYLFRSMILIMYELLSILTLLGVFIFLFSALGFFVWSDPYSYISAVPARFSYFRSFIQSIITMSTLTTTENYPDCMIDYISVSYVNFFIFVIFIVLSIFFSLNVVLSTVYSSYQDNLRSYYLEHRARDFNALARAFQYLCDSNKLMSRGRFRTFMLAFDGLNHLDSDSTANSHLVHRSNIRADFMYSMLRAKLYIVQKNSNPDVSAFLASSISEVELMQNLAPVLDSPMSFSDFVQLVPLIRCHFFCRCHEAAGRSQWLGFTCSSVFPSFSQLPHVESCFHCFCCYFSNARVLIVFK